MNKEEKEKLYEEFEERSSKDLFLGILIAAILIEIGNITSSWLFG